MNRRYTEAIVSFILLIIFAFYSGGINMVKKLLINLVTVFWWMLGLLNSIALQLIGDSILTLLLKTSITYFIVGLILIICNIPRGKLGHLIGKTLFWIVGFVVVFVLNIIAGLVFKNLF